MADRSLAKGDPGAGQIIERLFPSPFRPFRLRPIPDVTLASKRLADHRQPVVAPKHIILCICVLAAGCAQRPPIKVMESLEDRFERHMAEASRWCVVRDWRKIFAVEAVGERIRLRMLNLPETPSQGRDFIFGKTGCILNTFGVVTFTDHRIEFPASSLQTTIRGRRID